MALKMSLRRLRIIVCAMIQSRRARRHLRFMRRTCCSGTMAIIILTMLLLLAAIYTARLPTKEQLHLNYIAESLDVKYYLIQNSKKEYMALTNTGDQPMNLTNVELYFYHMLRKIHLDSKFDGIAMELHHVDGSLFRLRFSKNTTTQVLQSQEKLVVSLKSSISTWARSDVSPNWYITSPGCTPVLLHCTVGEDLNFAKYFWEDSSGISDATRLSMHYSKAVERYNNNKNLKRFEIPPLYVIPTPVEIVADHTKPLNIRTNDWVVVADAGLEEGLPRRMLLPLSQDDPGKKVIRIRQGPVDVIIQGKAIHSKEAYRIDVSAQDERIEVTSPSTAGVFYAMQTIYSTMDEQGNIPQLKVQDAPRFSYRGTHIDVSRNFFQKDVILRTLQAMSKYKMNKLHFHLSDDEGWRLEIPGLPELTEIGARRCHDPTKVACLMPQLGSGPEATGLGSGFYTTSDYQEILDYAAHRHIEIIPEFDMPAHAHAAIQSMLLRYDKYISKDPQKASKYLLNDFNDDSEFSSVQLFTENVMNPCLSSTYVFIEHVIKSVIDLHKGHNSLKTIHLGGDEVPRGAWEKSTVCMQMGKSREELRQMFAEKIINITAKYQVDVILWDAIKKSDKDIVHKDQYNMPDNQISINVWDIGHSGQDIAHVLLKKGYKVILSNANYLYFDHPQIQDPEERGLYWASRSISLEHVFKYRPLCGGYQEKCKLVDQSENILGIQSQLWTETIRSADQFYYMLFPRLLAVAERSWHQAPWETDDTKADLMQEDWEKFASTLGLKELSELDSLGIWYRLPLPGAVFSKDGTLSANCEIPGFDIMYSVDFGQTWKVFHSGMVFHKDSGHIDSNDNREVWLAIRSHTLKRASDFVRLNFHTNEEQKLKLITDENDKPPLKLAEQSKFVPVSK
ncbi:uncharacterized protein LOC106171732 [Lingula anatina]|uniref:beta-N-acetylhexosaminidase n=1 Tax=Lingula anatina TaxID=7574 RepID=A0A1S3JB58_LINAN|nr:uncharacterized protein LOC106171732 [Lingula anatina]|eukprot:XP_013407640.1 uncharacterized protein LOC106171732 [Lingula anatina]